MSTRRDVDRPADSVFPAEYGSPSAPLPPAPPPLPPPPGPLPDEDLEPAVEQDMQPEPETERPSAPPAPEPPQPSQPSPSPLAPALAKLSSADARSAVNAVGRRLRRALPTNALASRDNAPEAPVDAPEANADGDVMEAPDHGSGAADTAAEAAAPVDPPAEAPGPPPPPSGPAARAGVATMELPFTTLPAPSRTFGRRWRDTPIVEREATASPEDDTVYEALPRKGNRRQRVRITHGVHSRRLIRRIDVWTVLKVSFVFYTLLLLIVLVAGVAVWNVAQAFGLIHNIEKSIRSLFDLTSFHLHPLPVLAYTAVGGAVLTVIGTLLNVVMALLYNLISDIVGGAQVVVVTTEPE